MSLLKKSAGQERLEPTRHIFIDLNILQLHQLYMYQEYMNYVPPQCIKYVFIQNNSFSIERQIGHSLRLFQTAWPILPRAHFTAEYIY